MNTHYETLAQAIVSAAMENAHCACAASHTTDQWLENLDLSQVAVDAESEYGYACAVNLQTCLEVIPHTAFLNVMEHL